MYQDQTKQFRSHNNIRKEIVSGKPLDWMICRIRIVVGIEMIQYIMIATDANRCCHHNIVLIDAGKQEPVGKGIDGTLHLIKCHG